MSSLEDYKETGDSLNLKTIDDQAFTIVAWERSDYDNNGETTKGIKFTTKEQFDGGLNKLHTTRMVIVQKFYTTKNGETIPTKLGIAANEQGKTFKVKCVLKQPQKSGGKEFYDLEDVKTENQESID